MIAKPLTVVVIGAGAAGFFGAIACAEANPDCHVILLEKTRQMLSKVRISGGGRCNVTHACFDPASLTQYYPRGNQALRGPFTRFQPKDTIQWFESRGVVLKTESDGRMFPITDSSETIINCLLNEAKKNKVDIRLEHNVTAIQKTDSNLTISLLNKPDLLCDRVLIATGSNPKIYHSLEAFGHTIEPLVPSLFTFNIPHSPLVELAGISVPKAILKIEGTQLVQTGPLLITHWGFSGPAVLKLSAWGARILHDLHYKAKLVINWLPDLTQEALREKLLTLKKTSGAKLILSDSPSNDLPRNLWKKLLFLAEIQPEQRWATLSKEEMQKIMAVLQANHYQIDGKSTYKEEFVTCGGVKLDEVNFKTMESRLCPGIYFAGEVLNVDGVTGGFNFQNAWTTSWIAGHAMAS